MVYSLNAESQQDCILAIRKEEDAHAHQISAVSVATQFVFLLCFCWYIFLQREDILQYLSSLCLFWLSGEIWPF